MDKNFGKKLAMRETRAKTIFLIRMAALVVLAAAVGTAIVDLINPDGDRIAGFVGLGLTPIAVFFLIKCKAWFHKTAILYEEGVVIKSSGDEQGYHFSQIAGLREDDSRDAVIATGYGLVGALLSGVEHSALDYSLISPNNKGVQNRRVCIEPNNKDLESVDVVSTAGHDLADIYTVWLIKENHITRENVNSHTISFGDEISFKEGIFSHTHAKSGKLICEVAAKDITSITLKERDEGMLKFYAPNEKGKSKCVISIAHTKILNIDLLFYIHNLTKLDA